MNFEIFCRDPQLINEPISPGWVTFYRAVEGLPLDAEQLEMFRLCTGRDAYEPRSYTEATVIAGRRSEKTSTGVKFGLWKAMTGGYEHQVRRGELLRVPIIAQDLRIARDIKHAAETMLLNSPVLSNEIADVFANEIRLRNGVALTCYPSSFRSTRGLAMPVALLDECAFWVVEGSSDVEVVKSVKPGQLQFGPARRLIKLSTPWQRSGLVYDEFNRRRERPDLLVWQASTSTMTPRIAADLLEAERAADPAYFAREYLAEFVDDLEAFLSASDVDAAVETGVRECPPVEELKAAGAYVAALDASGLTGRDRFVFGIAHRSNRIRGDRSSPDSFVDLLRAWSKAPVPLVVDEIASVCRAYGVTTIIGDQFAASFLGELLHQRGIALHQKPFTRQSKIEIFLALKRALAEGTLRLLDLPEALRELRQLEAKKLSGGGYAIAAPRGGRDDYVAVIGLLAHNLAEGGGARGEDLVGVVSFSEGGGWKRAGSVSEIQDVIK